MQPIDYTMKKYAGAGDFLSGYGAGLDIQKAEHQLAVDQEAAQRARELHPLALEGAGLGLEAQRSGLETAGLNRDLAKSGEQRAATEFEQKQAAAEGLKERQGRFQTALMTLTPESGAADYINISNQFPELSKGLTEGFEKLDATRRKGMAQVLGQSVVSLKNGNSEQAIKLANDYADAAEKSGDPGAAASARVMATMIEGGNADAALASGGLALSILDPDVAKVVLGGGGPKVQSSQMIGGRASVQTMSDGTTRVVDTSTGKEITGQDALDLISAAQQSEADAAGAKSSARETGKIEAEIDLGGQAEASKSLGKEQSKIVIDSFTGANNFVKSMGTIETAIDAIDKDGNTGFFYKRLPALKKETATLRNALDQMGLDVVGSVTFGALSEGELRLAMNVAAPRDLGPEPLRKWLVEKLEAQKKARTALQEQATFLSDPRNTLNDWIEKVNATADQQSTPKSPSKKRPSYLKDK